MAGPWEKYQQSAPQTPSGPWDRYRAAEPERGGVALNTTAGINQGIYSTLGAPVDLARGAINLGISGINAATGAEIGHIPSDSIGGSQWIAGTAGKAHPVLDPANTTADTAGERIARGVGEGVGFTAAPQVALGAAARGIGGKALNAASRFVGKPASVGAAGAEMVAGAGAGAGATAAMEVTPDKYDPLSATVGGLAGGVVGTLAATAPTIARVAKDAASDFVAPMTQSGRQRIAARQLQEGASDPSALRSALDDGVDEIVPGSQPTTFQATGDLGIGRMERGAAAKRPDLFAERRATQNTARLEALTGIQDKGAPEAVAQAVRGHMKRIDDETQAALNAATQAAQGKTAALGTGTSPQASGTVMREALENARAAAKEQERAVWRAVDPDGSLALPAAGTKKTADEIIKGMKASEKPIMSEEADIHAILRQYDEVVPFGELTALQSRLKTEMRAERLANGESPAYRRMTQLNNAIEGDLETAIAGKVAQEADAVARGVLREEDTLFANLRRQQEAWFAGRSANAQSASGGTSASGNGSGGSAAVPGIRGAMRQTGGRPEPTSGDPRLQGNALEPNFDEAALGRLNEARSTTKQRVETFDNKTLAPIRKRPSTTSPYDMPASVVPERIFYSRPRSAEDIAKYRAAVGDEQALPVIQEYAVDRLRASAMEPDGTLNPAKLEAWRKKHAEALQAFPSLDAKLSDASRASETMFEVGKMRKARMDAAKLGKVGALLNVEDPADVVNTIGGVFGRQDAAREMRRIRSAIGDEKDATEGLRKSVVDYMMKRFVGNTEVATSGQSGVKSDQFQTFIRANKATLRNAGFDDDDIARMTAIADDLQRSNRSITSVKNPGGSNTTQDILASGEQAQSMLGRLVSVIGAGAGAATGGPLAAMAGVMGGQTVSAMRRAGLETVDDLVADALLHPQRAKILLSTVYSRPDRGLWRNLGNHYRAAARATTAITGKETGEAGNEGRERKALELTVTK